jgi:hypothetical protein
MEKIPAVIIAIIAILIVAVAIVTQPWTIEEGTFYAEPSTVSFVDEHYTESINFSFKLYNGGTQDRIRYNLLYRPNVDYHGNVVNWSNKAGGDVLISPGTTRNCTIGPYNLWFPRSVAIKLQTDGWIECKLTLSDPSGETTFDTQYCNVSISGSSGVL